MRKWFTTKNTVPKLSLMPSAQEDTLMLKKPHPPFIKLIAL